MLKAGLIATSIFAASAPALMAQTAETPDTIVVLDVSNSMWGQIDGTSKIEIAREVIGDLMRDLDPATRVGLVAYGHRRKSDCRDIELVLPVAPLDAGNFSAAVNSLTPRGRTPLTEAVREAAEVLNYRDSAGRIILVSDGLESCNANPCALAAELARNGVDFTAHVIGFDVAGIEDQSQLSCLAEQTGGLYLTAESTDELAAALDTIIEAEAPPAPVAFSVTLSAPREVFANTGFEATWAAQARTGDAVLMIPEGGNPAAALARMDATTGSPARLTAPAAPGLYTLLYTDATGKVLARADITVVQPASVNGPESAIAGAPIEISWSGPDNERDFITIVEIGAREGKYYDYAYTSDGSPVNIATPDRPGAFEIRYVSGRANTTLARQPITLIEPEVALEAVGTAPAGGAIEIIWQGPNNARDFITIVEAGAREGQYNDYAYTTEGSPVSVTAPDAAGEYEIRYVSGQSNATLASRPLVLEDVAVSLEATGQAPAGSRIEITWKGPNAARDFITIVAPDAREGQYNDYAYTSEGSVVEVMAPDAAGEYEIRYVSGQSNATLASRPLVLEEVAVSLEAAASAIAGSNIEIRWKGPNATRDYITIVAPDAREGQYNDYAYTTEGPALEVQSPDIPGNYEIRYVSGQSDATLARLPLTLTAPTVLMEPQGPVVAGGRFAVRWLGPDNKRDYITIAVPGMEDREYVSYVYTNKGALLEFTAPEAAGSYELRYVSGQSDRVLARMPLDVSAN